MTRVLHFSNALTIDDLVCFIGKQLGFIVVHCIEKRNKEKVTIGNKTRITSLNNRNCGWRWLFSCHFSHVTKSRTFKNLNFKKTADRNSRCTFLKNRFRHLKLYSIPLSWLARSRCHMSTFWKTKDSSSHFWGSQPFSYWQWNFTNKEDLNRQKQVFLLNFRFWPAQEPKIWSIFYGK